MTAWTHGASAQKNNDCLACHGDRSLVTEKNGKTVSLFVDEKKILRSTHGSFECISCHEGFDPNTIPHTRSTPVRCQQCHEGNGYEKSIHQTMASNGKHAPSCITCHGIHDVLPETDPESPIARQHIPNLCGRCHGNEKLRFAASDHGKALAAKLKGAPVCSDCHGEHGVYQISDKNSKMNRRHQDQICLACHVNNPDVRERVGSSAAFIESYEKSVHGKAMTAGNEAAPTCSDCHGGHDMLTGSNVASRVNKRNIESTCGRCHTSITNEFHESIHGKAIARGILDAPTCTNCHGEHQILAHTDPSSPIAALNVSSQVCSPCHSSLKLTQRYGLNINRYATFNDSYHGLAVKAGDAEVANCASCHGIHNIKSSSDSTSTIAPKNLATTCGKCHAGANENFTKGSVHVTAVTARQNDNPLLYWISSIYIMIIISTIGGMGLHNLVDFYRKGKNNLLIRRGVTPHDHHYSRALYIRMTLEERIQHGSLMISFITLVLSGFALKYPEVWWVQTIRNFIPFAFEIRSIAHRVAAVVMVLASVYHLYYIFFVPRGKQLIRDMFPRLQDGKELIAMLKYNLGLSSIKPKFGRFSYIEKSEYWALVWGTIVMAATGTILWFDNYFLGILSKLWWDVARAIHYYEAWLATLAIIVWHFYFVIFNPDVYPINLAWLKGTLTEEEMYHEHPLELEHMKREEQLQVISEEETESNNVTEG
jgi:cytochrome b subunit of formate dehydrogenase